jgi:hypothetical protein
VIGTHCAEFVNLEPPVLHAGASLHVEERARRLNPLGDPDDNGQDREDEDHYRQ